jgi:hypothetical protein
MLSAPGDAQQRIEYCGVDRPLPYEAPGETMPRSRGNLKNMTLEGRRRRRCSYDCLTASGRLCMAWWVVDSANLAMPLGWPDSQGHLDYQVHGQLLRSGPSQQGAAGCVHHPQLEGEPTQSKRGSKFVSGRSHWEPMLVLLYRSGTMAAGAGVDSGSTGVAAGGKGLRTLHASALPWSEST